MTSTTGVSVEHVSETLPRQFKCNKSIAQPTINQVRIVCEYPDVFPDGLPGMPLDRDIEFIIELIPGTGPIAQRPYSKNPSELVELKKKLDAMLEIGLIQPSASPWRSPVLFVDKKDITMTSTAGVSVEHVSETLPHQFKCNKSIDQPTIDQVRIVCEYLDVFPDVLLGMPPDRDI